MTVCVGMIGGGTVGGGVYKALSRNGDLLALRMGVRVCIKRIAVKAFDEPRTVDIPYSIMTTDWHEVVNDPDVQVVVELMGGTTLAKEIILTALKQGKSVVTANKALLAAHGQELFSVAREHHTGLYFEASVAGGIPILKSIRESFVCNHFASIYGIVNGTCNYILTQMAALDADFQTVLAEAQKKGYAEAKPSLDVDGHDAHHKVVILTSLAYNAPVEAESVYRQGIGNVTVSDIEVSKEWGYTLKLLGIVKTLKKDADGVPVVQAGVSPTLVPSNCMLAGVNGVFNALDVCGDVVGETFFYGKGAGQDATASAVVSDIADAALNVVFKTPLRYAPVFSEKVKIASKSDVMKRFYVRVMVDTDKSKNQDMEHLKSLLERFGVKMEKTKTVQSGSKEGIVCLTAPVLWKQMEEVQKNLTGSDENSEKAVVFPIEDFADLKP